MTDFKKGDLVSWLNFTLTLTRDGRFDYIDLLGVVLEESKDPFVDDWRGIDKDDLYYRVYCISDCSIDDYPSSNLTLESSDNS